MQDKSCNRASTGQEGAVSRIQASKAEKPVRVTRSQVDVLLLVVDLRVELVEVSNECIFLEGHQGLLVVVLGLGKVVVQVFPLSIVLLSVFFRLFDAVLLAIGWSKFESLIKGVWVNFFQNGLESDETFLENLVPVTLCQVHDHGDEHWESDLLVSFEDVEEVVILKEAHSAVGNLQMDSTDALDNSFEQFGDERLDFLNLAHFKHFLQLGQEESLFNAIGEWPVLEKALERWNSKCSVFGQEEHRATKQLLVERGARLHLVKWNDNVLKEDYVLVSQCHRKS